MLIAINIDTLFSGRDLQQCNIGKMRGLGLTRARENGKIGNTEAGYSNLMIPIVLVPIRECGTMSCGNVPQAVD